MYIDFIFYILVMAKETLKSFDDLPKVLSKKTQWRETTQYPGYKIHEKYPEGSYSSHLQKQRFDKIPEIDERSVSWEKYDSIIAAWVDARKYSTSESFWLLLEKNKTQILETLDIPWNKTWSMKKDVSKTIVENTKHDYRETRDILNKISKFVYHVFEDRTKHDYTQWYVHLLKANDWSFTNWFYKALVSSVSPKWIVVTLFKKGEKLFIPEKNLLKKDMYLRGDEIVVCAEKKDNNLSLMEVDKKFLQIQKQYLLNKTLSYMPKHAKQPFEGKIIGVWEDINKGELIFMPKSGVQFAVSIDTFLEWLKNAELYKQEILKEQKAQVKKEFKAKKIEKPYISSRVVWDGKHKYSSKVKGRDGKKVQHEIETV